MTTLESLKETVKRELPAWLESDPAFREAILGLTANLYSRRDETNDWFHQTLDEMRRERERQDALWRKNDERLERERQESERKWDANQAELAALREEQNRKWEANQVELAALHKESLALGKRIDRSIGALGARWGLRSEKAFRDALAGILEKTFDVEVLNVSEYDDAGEVFGRPDQIEIDVIIKNGLLILCELKSSIDKAGM
ncbi:PD-(D/E)XK nuclease family protein, partial [Thiorhodovibrio winogradskyi]